jgi:hypothetical protein
VAEGADVQAADVSLTRGCPTEQPLEQRHISELHELAAAAGVPKFRTLRRAELAAAINAALQSEVPPRRATAQQSAFAVIRLERGSRWTPSPKPEQVGVEKIVSSEEEAQRDTERLNSDARAEQSGATYFWRAVPIE